MHTGSFFCTMHIQCKCTAQYIIRSSVCLSVCHMSQCSIEISERSELLFSTEGALNYVTMKPCQKLQTSTGTSVVNSVWQSQAHLSKCPPLFRTWYHAVHLQQLRLAVFANTQNTRLQSSQFIPTMTFEVANLCCQLAEVDREKHPSHKQRLLKVTWSPEMCSRHDSRPDILAWKETGEDSAEGSNPKPPDEVRQLTVLAAEDRILDLKMASVWTT